MSKLLNKEVGIKIIEIFESNHIKVNDAIAILDDAIAILERLKFNLIYATYHIDKIESFSKAQPKARRR